MNSLGPMVSPIKSSGTFPAATIVLVLLVAAGTARAESATPSGGMASASGSIELAEEERAPHTCLDLAPPASPSRPTWTGGASISECGELQTDFGWSMSSMGAGVHQDMFPSSARYGLTQRLELRWAFPAHIVQDGGGQSRIVGISDENASFQYEIRSQGKRSPALAFGYGIKIPAANPRKGFGSGYYDHQLVFFVSRDIKRLHVDCNAVGTIAGGADGQDGAAQFGLALSMPISKRLALIIDNFGGSQPGTADRYGATLFGATWVWKPSLVLDAAFSRAYTAGSPRQTFTMGVTRSIRLDLPPLTRHTWFTHLLGR